jgi:hypothetical protein
MGKIRNDEQHRRALEQLVHTDREPERGRPERRAVEGEAGAYQRDRELAENKGRPKPARS